MAIAFVQDDAYYSESASATTAVKAFTGNVAAGSLIVVAVSGSNTGTVTATSSDSINGAHLLAVGPTVHATLGTQGFRQWIFYFANSGSGACTVTVSFSATIGFRRLMILEYSGIATSSALDQTAAATGNSGTADSGAQTTTQADELIFGLGINENGDITTGSGFTGREAADLYTKPEDKIVSSTGSYNATFGGSSTNWIAQMATFKAPGSGTILPMMMQHHGG